MAGGGVETQEENRTRFLTAGLDGPCYPQPIVLTRVPDFFHELYKKLTNEEGFDFYSPWQTPTFQIIFSLLLQDVISLLAHYYQH